MTISQTAEYALRAVVWLARQSNRSLGTHDIAEATHVPPGYLSKVLQGLSRVGLVSSRPGRAGGFVLSRSPSEISVLDVINATDPIERIRVCPLGLAAHSGDLCPLHRRLDAAIALMEKAFADTSIAELLHEADASVPLCEDSQTGNQGIEAAPASSDQTKRSGRNGRRPRPKTVQTPRARKT
jgi:Rrf2 family transcriptional regulator, nitric oxide-sensitive transcriptional repressor